MNLHAKVFLGFWLSMLCIAATWLITDQHLRVLPAVEGFDELGAWEPAASARRGGPERRARHGELPPQVIFRVFYSLRDRPLDELPAWIGQLERRLGLRVLVFDRQGEEIFGAETLPGAMAALRKLGGQRRRALHREGGMILFAQEFNRPDGERLAAVVALPPASPFMHALRHFLWLRLLLAVVITGLISFAVSRYLTRPLQALRLAARRLAAGELDARIDAPPAGGDETAQLARDFNAMAERLQQQIQGQKRLLYDISHELRSPLARLRVALALAERNPGSAAEQLARIEREAGRLDELIGQLLEIPRHDIALADCVDLVALLSGLCADADYEARADGKRVLFHTALRRAPQRAHADLLRRAFENVIRNAVHHSPRQSRVDVSLAGAGQGFAVEVCDRGEGLPAELLERVFEPFYRVDDARSRETGGFGLGLSIARQAVLRHGGRIRARPRAEGGGLCVAIALPRHWRPGASG